MYPAASLLGFHAPKPHRPARLTWPGEVVPACPGIPVTRIFAHLLRLNIGSNSRLQPAAGFCSQQEWGRPLEFFTSVFPPCPETHSASSKNTSPQRKGRREYRWPGASLSMTTFAHIAVDKDVFRRGWRNPSHNVWHRAPAVVVVVSGQPNVPQAGKAMRPAVSFLGFRAHPPSPPFQQNRTGFDI
jgi:hypothetical protein